MLHGIINILNTDRFLGIKQSEITNANYNNYNKSNYFIHNKLKNCVVQITAKFYNEYLVKKEQKKTEKLFDLCITGE